MWAATSWTPRAVTLAVMERAGGQAVFEGVMMRANGRCAVAVRTASGGIEVRESAAPTWGAPLKKVPVVRGLVALAEALPLGLRSLAWSSSRGSTRRRWDVLVALAVASIAPAWIGRRLTGSIGLEVLEPVVEMGLGIAMIWAYLKAAGKLDEIVRLFANHGAEHKTVNAYEAGAPLTVESVQRFSTRHPRCGTSFVLLVIAVSMIASFVVGTSVLLLPAVLGIAAELQLRLAELEGSVLSKPGMALQRLTTREPSDAQVEVAIAALQAVLPLRHKDAVLIAA